MRVKCHAGKPPFVSYSNYHDLEYGALQGSCLGPLLFMVFVNDLYLNLNNADCILFADNTTIYMGHRNLKYLEFCIDEDLRIIADWFQANHLTLNLSKTVGMLFTNSKQQETPKVEFDTFSISFVDCTKFLGMWIDQRLSWSTHVNNLCLKIRRNENLLKQSKNFLNEDCLKMLYYAQIFSYLCYGISIWGPMATVSLKSRLQKLQTSCLQHVFRCKDVWSKDYNILNISKLITLELCKLDYKLINQMLPVQLLSNLRNDQFNKTLNKTHRYSTNQPKPTTKLYHNSFLCQPISAYQSFMLATSGCKNLKQYSTCCKKILHEQ